MNKFIFIPGKNPKLSLAELASWFDSNGIYFRMLETGNGFIAAEAEKSPEADNLGGMIKVCRLVESFVRTPNLHPRKLFDHVQVKALTESSLFGVSVYPDSATNNKLSQNYASALKKDIRKQGIKSKFMQVPKGRSSLTHVEVINKKLEEIVICIGKSKIHIAKTSSVHNPFEFQKRDIRRPRQRPMYSIPPRLAKIMINLTGSKGVLLDPFCGIGTILQEAALMGFEILGMDIDEKCALDTIENLNWLSQDYRLSLSGLDKKILKADATKLSEVFEPRSIDAIVTEPNLGPALKIPPDENKAEAILRGLKPLYEKSLKEFSAILKDTGRICMVTPRFEYGEHFGHLEMEKLAARANLKPVDILGRYKIPGKFPYIDREPRHRTIREIWVFEKIPEPASRPEDLPELRWTKKNAGMEFWKA